MSRLQSAAGRVPRDWSFDQWPLRRKLAAALILPMFLAFSFGALRVKSDFDSARQLSSAADTVLVIRPIVDYNLAVQRLAAAESIGGGGVIAAITKYESAAADLRIAVKAPGVPESVKASAKSALSLGQAVRTAKTQSGFSDIVIDKSANTASLMSSAVSDLGLTDDPDSAKIVQSLQDTIAAQRAMTGQQLNLANTIDGASKMRAIGQAGAETAALTRLQSEAPGASSQVRQLLNENGRRTYTLQADAPTRQDIQSLGIVFQSSNQGYTTLTDGQLVALETNLRDRAASHRTAAIVNAVLVAVALLAAMIIVVAMMRSLLNPIRMVRQGALDVARKRLPEAVAKIRDGEEAPAFEPIPVHTTEEMGQLARAVDDLHTQALTLAGEQARLRVQVGHMFETLSRRSTSLIDQQLTLIERLESDEEDPKRLQSLFRLDHLAARMRRNSDSLLVLAGTSTRRGVSGAVSVSDAVRAAVSEVENYERIDIGETSTDQVLGAVGSDLIHLLAEIVDNALAYSPPHTRVAIRGARTSEGGLLIEVSDHGLGMPPKELASLNDRLAHGGDITADTARRMGLFVVGSLAKRHGIAVRLRRNADDKQGITVSVHMPAGLLADDAAAKRPARPQGGAASVGAAPAATQEAPTSPTESVVGGVTKSGLPARVRGASGAPTTPVPGAAKKVLPTRTPGAHGPSLASGAAALPPKPVIETVGTAPDTAADTPLVNGNAAAADGEPKVNGHAPKGEEPKVNGHAAQGHDVPVNGNAPHAGQTAADVTGAAAAAVDQPTGDPAEDEASAVPGEGGSDAASEVRSPAGLPVRKPRASQITEYREFADAPSEPDSDARPEAPTGRTSRLAGWLPGRAKAEAAARAAEAEAEADAAEPHRMPSNLSAWLDHRAKIVEAKELGTAESSESVDAREGGEEAEPSTDVDTDVVASEELEPEPERMPAGAEMHVPDEADDEMHVADEADDEMHVPDEWVAEVAGEPEAHSESDSHEPALAAHLEADETEPAAHLEADEPEPAAHLEADEPEPAAHLEADEPEPEPEATSLEAVPQPETAPAADAVAVQDRQDPVVALAERDDETVPAAPSGGDAGPLAGLPTRVPGASGSQSEEAPPAALGRLARRAHTTSFFGARKAREVVQPVIEAEVEPVVEAEVEPVVEAEVEPLVAFVEPEVEGVTDEPVVEAEVEPLVAFVEPEVEDVTDEPAPVAEVEPLAESAAEDEDVNDEVQRESQPAPTSNLNDTPIFRAMMSRWLTDDTESAAAPDSSWSSTEADSAWSAAARIEEVEPLEESAAGLPKRRPGSLLIPGAIEQPDEQPVASAAGRRDPEAIRRSLNRHQQGVSSARTETQDGTQREEADVHH